jgi:hypothetical protein
MTYNQRRSRLVASAGAGEPPNPQMHQNQQRLYQLIRQSTDIADHTFSIEFFDDGVQAYAFTFG